MNGGGGQNAPPGRYFGKKLTYFYFILVLQVLAKKVGQIGVVIRKYFDFVEGSSQFSIQISENFGKKVEMTRSSPPSFQGERSDPSVFMDFFVDSYGH